jgi:hypothetical protein
VGEPKWRCPHNFDPDFCDSCDRNDHYCRDYAMGLIDEDEEDE